MRSLLILAMLLMVGCDEQVEGTDSGEPPGTDSGVEPGTDAGPPPFGMVEIPAATGTMGCDGADPYCEADELPTHNVTLTYSFAIDEEEVSTVDYRACVLAGACPDPTCRWEVTYWVEPGYPVTCIPVAAAEAYCVFAGKRLPTEAEWERAARGTDGGRYPWGEGTDIDPDGPSGPLAGALVAPEPLNPIGTSVADVSEYGVRDMAGSVREVTSDGYGAGFYGSGVGATVDPVGEPASTVRVARGGSYLGDWEAARSSNRTPLAEAEVMNGSNDLGFRCVVEMP